MDNCHTLNIYLTFRLNVLKKKRFYCQKVTEVLVTTNCCHYDIEGMVDQKRDILIRKSKVKV